MDFTVLIVAVATIAHASAGIVSVPDATFYFPMHPPPPAAASDQDTFRTEESDALVAQTHHLHNYFTNQQNVSTRDQYTYGYEYYDWKTRANQEHYESRYGDVAYGTSSRVSSGAKRTTVQYTVDTPHGFQATVSRSVQIQKRSPGPMPSILEGNPLRSTLVLGDDVNPHVLTAYDNHHKAKDFFKLESPLQLSWGYTLKEARTGRTRGQYETSHGDQSEGRFTVVEVDGFQVTVDYTVDARGFAYSIRKTPAKSPALVYTGRHF